MGIAKDFRRSHLVWRLAQSPEESVEHPGVSPHSPHGAGAAFLLGQECVNSLIPAASVTTMDQILRRHDLSPYGSSGVTTIHALVRREVKEL